MFKLLTIQLIIKFIASSEINVAPPSGDISDTILIQTAICEAKNLIIGVNCGIKQSDVENIPNRDTSGTITLQSGTYNIYQLYLYSNLIFKGQGQGVTILKLQDSAESYFKDIEKRTGGQAGFIRILKENNITISDMTKDDNKENQINYLRYRHDNTYYDDGYKVCKKFICYPHAYGRFAIYSEISNDLIISNLEVKNWQGYGLDPHGEGESEYGDYSKYGNGLIIKDCYVHDNDWDGVTIDKSINVKAYNNLVVNNGRHGFNLVTGTQNTEIYDNTIINNGNDYLGRGKGCGITAQNNQLYDILNINIHHNTIEDSNYGGICLNSVINSEIHNNIISNSGNYCLRLNIQSTNYKMLYEGYVYPHNRGAPTTTNYNVIHNNICDKSSDGILIRKGEYNTFYNNNIETTESTFGVKNIDEELALATNEFTNEIYGGNVLLGVCYGDTDTSIYIPHPYKDEAADPRCNNGIIVKDICFESTCSPTGGVGCSGLCCTSILRTINWSCEDYAAPCLIQPVVYPKPGSDPTCSDGTLSGNGKYCCESGCSQCGGVGCGSLEGMCCTSSIIELDVSCQDNSSPCLMN